MAYPKKLSKSAYAPWQPLSQRVLMTTSWPNGFRVYLKFKIQISELKNRYQLLICDNRLLEALFGVDQILVQFVNIQWSKKVIFFLSFVSWSRIEYFGPVCFHRLMCLVHQYRIILRIGLFHTIPYFNLHITMFKKRMLGFSEHTMCTPLHSSVKMSTWCLH